MARLKAGNFALVHLNSDITSGDTKIKVDEPSVLPEAPHRLTIGEEIVEVTNISGNTLTIERGKEGTTSASHSQGDEAINALTAGMYNRLAGPLTWNQIEGKE